MAEQALISNNSATYPSVHPTTQTKIKELEFNSDHKTKLAYHNEKASKTCQSLTLVVIGPILAQFYPILPKQILDIYEGAKIQFRPENKIFET